MSNPPSLLGGLRPPLFTLGQVVATPGAIEALEEHSGGRWQFAALGILKRHVRGDWGDLCQDDHQANEDALAHDTRLLSAYRLPCQDKPEEPGTKLWVITERDRSATTILLPSEY
ncbi:type I restriction endonuclease subunit M [Armatimonas sp.]|uniref:type I restriction endonuclease subunit M n=1 Tax=Armatimonas sp. TaxID=1872638 RepID=UPI00374CFAEB